MHDGKFKISHIPLLRGDYYITKGNFYLEDYMLKQSNEEDNKTINR